MAGFAEAATNTPAEWVAAQTAPNLNPSNTLPDLATYWPYADSVELSQDLAARWGYGVKWNGYLTTASVDQGMTNSTRRNYKIAQLAINNPDKVRLQFTTSREYLPETNSDSQRGLPPDTYLRDAKGNFILDSNGNKIWSPEAPDSVLQQMALARSNGVRRLLSHGVPIKGIVLNGGEYGMGAIGSISPSSLSYKDPVVAAARGDQYWSDYYAERLAHQARIITDAVCPLITNRQYYLHYTADVARDRGSRFETNWDDAGTYGYKFVFPWLPQNVWPLESWSDRPSGETYYKTGWGSGGYEYHIGSGYTWDMLSQELNSIAQQIALGHTRFYDWLDSTKAQSAAKAPKYAYMGYLKCLYSAGMLGAVEQSYGTDVGWNPQQPDASFDASTPPRWLQAFLWQSQVYGLYTWLNDYLGHSDLLPGPGNNQWSWDMPAYEFPAVNDNDRNVRILVRRAFDTNHTYRADWLATAWLASDSETGIVSKTVAVDIPGLGLLDLTARTCGSVYRIRTNSVGEVCAKWLDANPDRPSENFTNSTAFFNEAPIAQDQTTHTLTNTARAVTLRATDVDADTVTYAVLSGPVHGQLSGAGQNRVYTPDAGWAGTDSFTFKAHDGVLESAVATVTLQVTSSNALPQALTQSVVTAINTGVRISLTGSDPDGDPLTFSVTTPPAHGTLSGTGDNRFYVPGQNWHGTDTFTFAAHDGMTNSATAVVDIVIPGPTVTPIVKSNTGSGTAFKRPGEDAIPRRLAWVSLSEPVAYPVVVEYTVTGGTASPGVDYETLSGKVVVRPGQLSGTIMARVYDDLGTNGSETISLALSAPSTDVYTVSSTGNFTTRLFDDGKPNLQVYSGGTLTRGGTPSHFRVQMRPPPLTNRVVSFTMSGTAVEGVDYILPVNSNHQVTVRSNATEATVPIVAIDNGLINGSCTARLTVVTGSDYEINAGHGYQDQAISDNPLAPQVFAPYATPMPGVYPTALAVTLQTDTPGASIRFTLDGTTPSVTNGLVYSGSFSVTSSVTIKAYACKSGSNDSAVIHAGYLIVTPGVGKTWVATVTNDWWDPSSWDSGLVPQEGDNVIINRAGATVVLSNSTPVLNSLIISNATVLFTNWTTALKATTVTIASNALLTCSGPFTNAPAMSNRVYLVCSNLTIDAGGRIDVAGKGYRGGVTNYGAGSGPGGGNGSDPAQGGGHGGYGGRQNGNGHLFGGGIYGSAAEPLAPGSGGGDAYDHQGGTHGGGAVRIDAAGGVTVNGSILADGLWDRYDGLTGRKGTGSGGSIYITCRTLAGTTGRISADGGTATNTNPQGSGGGGRIAVSNDAAAQALEPVPYVRFSANGGARYVGETSRGGMGSIYLTDSRLIADGLTNILNGRLESPLAVTSSVLVVTNRWLGFAGGVQAVVTGDVYVAGAFSKVELGGYEMKTYGYYNCRYDAPGGSSLKVGGNLVLTNAAQLRVFSGLTTNAATVPGSRLDVAGSISMETGATVLVYSHPTNGASPEIRAGSVKLATNAVVDASGWGYAAAYKNSGSSGSGSTWWGWGNGTGKGFGGGGAGHGGAGYAYSGQGGTVYGDSNAPALPGSGGGSGNSSWGGGGGGGGLVRLLVTDRITLKSGSAIRAGGVAFADMTPNSDRVGGGGAGGGIYLRCNTFNSETNAAILAPGGNSSRGNGGGGGGGRIAIWRVKDASSAMPAIDVAGGLGYTTGILFAANNGQPGTVVWGKLRGAGTAIIIK